MVTEEKKDSTDINVERKSLKQLLQHGERTELWELRNMQAIILDENLQDTITICTTQTEEMHGGIVHTHQQMDATGLLRHQKVTMQRWLFAEAGSTQVKIQTVFTIP